MSCPACGADPRAPELERALEQLARVTEASGVPSEWKDLIEDASDAIWAHLGELAHQQAHKEQEQ